MIRIFGILRQKGAAAGAYRTLADSAILVCITAAMSLWGGELHYHPDAVVERTITTVLTSYGNPDFFTYPALMFYLNAVLYGGIFAVLLVSGRVESYGEFIDRYLSKTLIDFPVSIHANLPGHMLTVVFAAIAVVCAYLTVMLLTKRRWAAYTAAACILGTPLWIANSHMPTVDIPLAGLAMATVWFVVRSIDRGTLWDLKTQIVAGVLAGLTASAKYNGAVVIAAAYVPMILLSWRSPRRLVKALFITGTAAAATFIITNPYVLIEYRDFLRAMDANVANSRHGHQGWLTGMPTAGLVHLKTLLDEYGLPALLLAAGGVVGSMSGRAMNRASAWVILSFPVLFFLPLALSRLTFMRYVVPLIPVLAVYTGLALSGVYDLLIRSTVIRDESARRRAAAVCTGLLIAAVAVPGVVRSIDYDIVTSREDTRSQLARALTHAGIDSELAVFADTYTAEDVLRSNLPIHRLNAGDDIEYLRRNLRRQKARYRFINGWASSRRWNQLARDTVRNMACESFDLLVFDSRTHDRIIVQNRDPDGLMTDYCHDYDRFEVIVLTPHRDISPCGDGSVRTCGGVRFPGPYIEIYATRDIADAVRAGMDRQGILYITAPGSRGYYFRRLFMRDAGADERGMPERLTVIDYAGG